MQKLTERELMQVEQREAQERADELALKTAEHLAEVRTWLQLVSEACQREIGQISRGRTPANGEVSAPYEFLDKAFTALYETRAEHKRMVESIADMQRTLDDSELWGDSDAIA